MSQKVIAYKIVKTVRKGDHTYHEHPIELYDDEIYYLNKGSALIKVNQLEDALHVIRCREFGFTIIEIELNP